MRARDGKLQNSVGLYGLPCSFHFSVGQTHRGFPDRLQMTGALHLHDLFSIFKFQEFWELLLHGKFFYCIISKYFVYIPLCFCYVVVWKHKQKNSVYGARPCYLCTLKLSAGTLMIHWWWAVVFNLHHEHHFYHLTVFINMKIA